MKLDRHKLMAWLPKVTSLAVVLFWLVVLLIYHSSAYFLTGIMVWTILLLTTIIAWKNEPVGGGIFIIIGSGYLIFTMGLFFPPLYLLGSAPFFMIGCLFILDHFYQEKTEAEEDDF